jgi:hypothetical protein
VVVQWKGGASAFPSAMHGLSGACRSAFAAQATRRWRWRLATLCATWGHHAQCTGVQGKTNRGGDCRHSCTCLPGGGRARRVTRRGGRAPPVLAPRLAVMGHEAATDRLRGKGLDAAVACQLPRQRAAGPRRQSTAAVLWPLTGQVDRLHGHGGGPRPGGERAVGDLSALADGGGDGAGPTPVRGAVGRASGGPWACSTRRPPETR